MKRLDFLFFSSAALVMSLILVGCKPVPPPIGPPVTDLRGANACPADLGPPQPCADIFTVDKVPVPCARCQGAEGCFDKDDGLYCVRGTCTSDPRCKLLGADVPDGSTAQFPPGLELRGTGWQERPIQTAGKPDEDLVLNTADPWDTRELFAEVHATKPDRVFVGVATPSSEGYKLVKARYASPPRDRFGDWTLTSKCSDLIPNDFYQYKEVWCRNRRGRTIRMLVEPQGKILK